MVYAWSTDGQNLVKICLRLVYEWSTDGLKIVLFVIRMTALSV
jgi:hypothetical protein